MFAAAALFATSCQNDRLSTVQMSNDTQVAFAINLDGFAATRAAEAMNADRLVYALFDADGNLIYKNGRTPVYPLLYAQITRRFKGWDVYAGVENLTNFTQKSVILGNAAGNDVNSLPRVPSFDASCIWGPLMGIKAHIGFRFTLWKKA